MRDRRIGTKLMLGFGSFLLLACFMAAVGLYAQQHLHTIVDELGREHLPRLSAIAQLDGSVSDYRAAEGAVSVSQRPSDIAAARRRTALLATVVEREVAGLSAGGEGDVAVLPEWRRRWAAFRGLSRRMVDLAAVGRDAEAAALYNGPARVAYDRLTAATAALDRHHVARIARRMAANDREVELVYAITLTVLLLAVLAAFGFLRLLVATIAVPIQTVNAALGDLADGRMDATVDLGARADEVGDLASALIRLRDQLVSSERARAAQADLASEAEAAKAAQVALIVDHVGAALSRLADGDLITRIDDGLTGPFAELKTDFNAAAEALRATLAQVTQVADGINVGADAIRQASSDLSRRTIRQAANLEQTAVQMTALTAAVRKTADDAGRASAAMGEARTDAERSGAIVGSAVEAMAGIERSASEIAAIIALIDEFAAQTGLLAFNASIEAARVGAAGQGFAVVADEIRALAHRSAEAAERIRGRIRVSREHVEVGANLVRETGETLGRIMERIREMREFVSEIATSATQQAVGIQRINTAFHEIDAVTRENAAMAETATVATGRLADEADDMTRRIARFRTDRALAVYALGV